jgi:Raf kinase inhibitor-like YbhB/YbcL family protein
MSKTLQITAQGIENGQPVPERFAHGAPDGKGGVRDSENIRPALRWQGAPENTRSFAIIVVDKDVPTDFSSANRPGQTISAAMPRRNFYHWLLADIPADIISLPEGRAGRMVPGINGKNSYGDGGVDNGIGYDGPLPPWNDERLHHYHFIVYALDMPSLDLQEGFSGEELESAMQGHILAQGEIVGTYTTNQAMRKAA